MEAGFLLTADFRFLIFALIEWGNGLAVDP
jgi:hypothetical protein